MVAASRSLNDPQRSDFATPPSIPPRITSRVFPNGWGGKHTGTADKGCPENCVPLPLLILSPQLHLRARTKHEQSSGRPCDSMDEKLSRKLRILADAAKYDASCSSSGAPRRSADIDGLGSTTGAGICHAYTPDGRCVSLLKILLTNYCLFVL